jgi:hypothetical protein
LANDSQQNLHDTAMSAKAEISWSGRTEEGLKRQVYARRVGGEWLFFEREKRFDQWQKLDPVPLADWMELLDSIRRRVARRLLPPVEEERVIRRIRERFPEVKL